MRQLDVGPAEVGDRLLADVGDAHADHQRHRERRGDDAAPELGLAAVLLVEMQRVGVHGQQREPDVVGLSDGAPGTVLVDIADREVLVVAPEALAIALRTHRFRRSDHTLSSDVIPAKAGTMQLSTCSRPGVVDSAFAGMTSEVKVAR
jgi:hypothetical protein